ncbi:MAG: bifunctional (p)ppGpp synthetase/guanosine-3',5'-bis(diphosphate) 3'-pyrophosphohydrolase [Phycisphaerales bacterium]|nr:bifunctional (p)ppGpp synthetase/guanosine-3',5'-bis(diphosphate) 3'-pyrophosphohydrolase [Phycisphaerales bacterium]
MTHESPSQRAAGFSARAHRGQLRRDGITPYSAHPARVALLCATLFRCTDEDTLAAAYLHDVIEDCACDYDEIAAAFGATVAGYVDGMTKDMRLREDLRERAYHEQLEQAPTAVRLIKLADTLDNLSDAVGDRTEKALGKARAAIKLARRDPALADAVAIMCDRLATFGFDSN